jgi:hypothetical protein
MGPVWKEESIGHDKWLNWSFKDRKTMTSMVSPHLNEFKWVASLWSVDPHNVEAQIG